MRRAIRCNSILSQKLRVHGFFVLAKGNHRRCVMFSNHLGAAETSCAHKIDMLPSYNVKIANVLANNSLCSIHLLSFRQPEEHKSNIYFILQP